VNSSTVSTTSSGLGDPPAESPAGAPRSRRTLPPLGNPGPLVLVTPNGRRFTSGFGAQIDPVAVVRFPNGELRTRVPAEVEGRDCVLIASITPPPGNVERVTLISHTLRRAGARRVIAMLPYLAYARQDVAPLTENLGLEWIGELLRASGVDAVVTVDVHSDRAESLLGLPCTSLSPAVLMADALSARWRQHDVTFVAPDEGAKDRCSAVADAAGTTGPIVWARKRRDAAGIRHLGLVGSPGERVLIVDDILDTGGTLTSCAHELRSAGVREIGLLVTHGLFTGDAWRPLVSEAVDEIWITDTVLSPRRPPKARIVPVAPLLSEAIRKLDQ